MPKRCFSEAFNFKELCENLIESLKEDDLDSIISIINQGLKPNSRLDCLERTAIWYVCTVEVLDFLISYQIDLNHVDKYGCTVLFELTFPDVYESYLKHGADPNIENKAGYTALWCHTKGYISTPEPDRYEIIRSLILHGADPYSEFNRETPYSIAKDCSELIDLFKHKN